MRMLDVYEVPAGWKRVVTNLRYAYMKADAVVAVDLPVVELALSAGGEAPGPPLPEGVPLVYADPSDRFAYHPVRDPRCLHLDCHRMNRWSRSLSEGLLRSTNSGLAAVNLADVLGADTIYLMGFEMAPGPYDVRNPYPQFLEQFERHAGDPRARVVNLTPGGNLECFVRESADEVLICRAGKS